MNDTRTGLNMELPEDRRKSHELLVAHFIELVQDAAVACSFELGAFSASFSRQIRPRLPNAQIFAFEANPHNHATFLAKENFTGIHYIHKAVADRNGTIEFCLQKEIAGKKVGPRLGNNSLLEKIHSHILYEKIVVDCVTLSDFVTEHNLTGQPSALWIDVEGANQQVLLGCEQMLSQVRLIFIEVEEITFWKNQWLEPRVREFLEAHDFELAGRDGEYPRQYNQIYVKRGA